MAYSPEMVSLLQQLRSRIFAEFGMKIRLADPQLLTLVGDLGKKSRDPFTRKNVVRIMELGGIAYDIDDTEKRRAAIKKQADEEAAAAAMAEAELSEITYRGKKVIRKRAEAVAPMPTANAASVPQKGTRQMYRGQVVYK